jgi:hypothetical protein
MRHLVLSTFVSLTMAGQAPAEFVVKTAQPALVSDPVPQPTPIARSETDTGNQAEAKPTPDKPLAFACRQIVPSAVRITYGPGADQAVLVDWKGGDTWNHVLRDAVQPLGLHLVMTTMAVEIRR